VRPLVQIQSSRPFHIAGSSGNKEQLPKLFSGRNCMATPQLKASMAQILVTNDDGIQAEGLRALVQALDGLGTISVVAPSHERSASAQSLTLRQPIFYEQIAEREWSVEGTPTDAVIIALHSLLPAPPDLVVSGINPGGNLGENVFYSGTVGAAMEAAINRIPAVAVSVVNQGKPFGYETAMRFSRELAELVLAEGTPQDVLLNVNIPVDWSGCVRLTRQSKKVTRNVLQQGTDPRGRTFFWIREQKPIEGLDPESDYAAVFGGAISVTPLQIDRTHDASLNHLSHWVSKLESRFR
jgi:5'-nucleotidase